MPDKKHIGKLFPNVKSAVASYDPATFIVALNKLSQAEFIAMRGNPMTAQNIEHFKTQIHEFRHMADHMATLWGQKSLLSYLTALNARLSNDPQQFHLINKYKAIENRLFYAEYYTEEYGYAPVKSLEQRWKWQLTTGLKLDIEGHPDEKRPIPMVHFFSPNDESLSRTPISVISLLETNAIAEEIIVHGAYLTTISETERPFHLKFFSDDTLYKLLYNQDLVQYNVAVHVTANVLGMTDIIEGFRISSAVATVVLNLPESVVSDIPIHQEFKPWNERSRAMIKQHEYGFLFLLLLYNYGDTYRKSGEFDINALLACSNLPPYEDLLGLIDQEFEAIQNSMDQFENFKTMFQNRAKTGREIFHNAGIGFEKKTFMEVFDVKKVSPDIYCNDTYYDSDEFNDGNILQKRPMDNLAVADWDSCAYYLNGKMDEFFMIRGI
jgi:hypothetical protein